MKTSNIIATLFTGVLFILIICFTLETGEYSHCKLSTSETTSYLKKQPSTTDITKDIRIDVENTSQKLDIVLNLMEQ